MNFAYNDTNPYPFSDDIFADEDGVGYALRMADANALSFHKLAVHLTSSSLSYLPYESAPALAFMFGGTARYIEKALVRPHAENGARAADYAGQTFLRRRHLRQTHPQICPTCLFEEQRALASWSLTMMCCCTRHKTCLVDRCACERPISWYRKSLLVCSCGRIVFDAHKKQLPAPDGALAICQQIEYLLGPAHFRLRPPDSVLSIFDGTTLDTFLRLVWAIGNFAGNCSISKPRILEAFPAPSHVMHIADTAHHRIQTLLTRRPSTSLRLWIPDLISVADDVANPADQALVVSLIERIRPANLKVRNVRGLPVAQGRLFED